MILHRTLTFRSSGLMAVGRLLGGMLAGVVVFMHTREDGCICTINVIRLADTWKCEKRYII